MEFNKLKIKLFYAPCDLGENDIVGFKIIGLKDLVDKIDELCHGKVKKRVFLLASEDLGYEEESNFVFISDSYLEIEEILLNHKRLRACKTFFLQEYESFEDAYSVALSMKENSELCYNNNK